MAMVELNPMECDSDDDDDTEAESEEEDIEFIPKFRSVITNMSTKYKTITFPPQTAHMNRCMLSLIATNLGILTLLLEFAAIVTEICIVQHDND